MKKVIFFTVVLLLIFSCKNYKEEKSIITQDQFNHKKNEALKNNLNIYLEALQNANTDKVIDYTYPDLFVWMQKKVPHNFNLDSIKGTIKTPILEAKKFNKENGISFQFQINKIKKKVVHKNHKIYIVLVSGIQKTENRKLQIDDEIVAISHNKGQDWKFMMKDDEMTKEILALRFPDETIKQLLEE
jgi:hypothetical protein